MRVFNISLNKMATTSMWLALDALGFESIHYSTELCRLFANGQAAEFRALQRDNIALHDVPVMKMYHMLARLFPAAKFIHVTRPLEDWLRSFKLHLNAPNIWPFAHTLTLGYPMTRDDYDDALCRKAYERHHADVAEFFRGKDNLLQLEIGNLSWEPLCNFLDRPVPDRSFPHVYKSEVNCRG